MKMNKKLSLSIAAAAAMTAMITGCGTDSVTSALSGSTSIVPADGYIYGSTVTCESGTATVSTDDNLTVTVNTSNPGLCTVTGGAHLIGGVYIESNATLSAIITADSNGTQNITPITSMVAQYAGSGASAATIKEARQRTLSVLGINPTGLTDAQLKAKTAVDTASSSALGAAGLTVAVKAKVATIFSLVDQYKTAGASATNLGLAIKNIVSQGSTVGISDQNSTEMATAMQAKLSGDVNSTLAASISAIASAVEKKVELAPSLDSVESTVDAALKAAAEQKTNVTAGNTVTAATVATAITAAVQTIQNSLEAVYIDDNVTSDNSLLRTALNGTAADTNASLVTGATSVHNFPVLSFKLSDRNVSDANYTAVISSEFTNKGNANLTYKMTFRDVVVDGDTNSSTYRFSLGSNSNISYSGTSFTGVATAYTTPTSGLSTTAGDNNYTLTNAITTTSSGKTDANLSQIARWVYKKLDYNTTYGGTHYGVNNNWSTNIILSMKDANSSNVVLYKSQTDGNLSTAATTTIKFDTTSSNNKTGAIIFNGNFTEN